MSDQTASRGTTDFRSRMQNRGPGRPGTIEKAQNPRQALGRLVMYLWPYKLVLGLVLAFVLIYTLLGLIGPYLMGLAIDKFIAEKDGAGLARIALLMLAAYVLNNIFQAAANWIMARLSLIHISEPTRLGMS